MATLDNKINRARPSLLKKKPEEEVSPLSEIDKEEKVETELDDLDLEKKLLASMQTFSPEDERKKVQKSYEDKSSRADYMELADKLQQAVTRYAAASKGLKSGVDLSNIPIQGADWEKIRDRYLKEKDIDLGDIDKRENRLTLLMKDRQDKNKEKDIKLNREDYLVRDGGLPVYTIQGKPGYFDEKYNLIPEGQVKPFEKDKDKRQFTAPSVVTGLVNADTGNSVVQDKELGPIDAKTNQPVTSFKPRPRDLPAPIVTSISAGSNAIQEMDRLIDMVEKGDIKTDWVKSGFEKIKGEWVPEILSDNVDSLKAAPGYNTFISKLQNVKSNYQKFLTGLQANLQEMENLNMIMGSSTNNTEVLLEKLKSARDSMKNAYTNQTNTFKRQNFNVYDDQPQKEDKKEPKKEESGNRKTVKSAGDLP